MWGEEMPSKEAGFLHGCQTGQMGSGRRGSDSGPSNASVFSKKPWEEQSWKLHPGHYGALQASWSGMAGWSSWRLCNRVGLTGGNSVAGLR